MAHFQLPDGTRLFVDDVSKLEKIGIPIGTAITLQLVGGSDPTGKSLVRGGANHSAFTISVVGVSGDTMTFTLKAGAAGTVMLATGDDSRGPAPNPLFVIAGDFGNHPGMEKDLIADICRKGDPVKIHAIQRMLNNNEDNLFEQSATHNLDPKYGNLACGIVVKKRGTELFGKMSTISYEKPYHEPLYRKVTDRNDVKYKSETLDAVRKRIGALLRDGTPVRVGVLDGPVGMTVIGGKLYAYWPGGHTVLIVGCDAQEKEFLYIDPWGSGSRLKYGGGIPGDGRPEFCEYLGLFTSVADPSRKFKKDDNGINLIRQASSAEGTFSAASGSFLEVVSGPR